jgi:hypothetical protein
MVKYRRAFNLFSFQEEFISKWTELSNLDIDLSLFRPVYAPKDFLEILSQVQTLKKIGLRSQEILSS